MNAHAGDLTIKVAADPAFIDALQMGLKVGALMVPKTQALPMRSRVRVLFDVGGGAAAIPLTAEVVYETADQVGLQIIEIKPEDRKRLDVILTLLKSGRKLAVAPASPAAGAAAPPPATPAQAVRAPALTIEREGNLVLDFPGAIHRRQNSGGAYLGEDSVFVLLQRLAAGRLTGLLRLDADGGAVTRIFFKDGRLVGADRKPLEEVATLGYLLRLNKRLSETDYRELRRAREQTGKPDTELLKGKVEDRDLQFTAAKCIHQILSQACATRKLRYKIEEGAAALKGTVPIAVNFRKALFRVLYDAAASYRTEELRGALEGHMNHFIVRADPLPFDVKELKLSADESRFWEVTLGKPVRLRNMFAVSAVGTLQSLRILFAMLFLGLIDFNTKIVPDDSQLVAHLKATLGEMEEMNHFDRLQVHWTALGPAIEKAFQRSCKEWETMEVSPRNRAEADQLVRQILEKLEESLRFLSEDRRRREYRDKLIEPAKREFTAELFAEHTRSYLFRKDRKQAQLYADMAMDLCPGKAAYRNLMSGG